MSVSHRSLPTKSGGSVAPWRALWAYVRDPAHAALWAIALLAAALRLARLDLIEFKGDEAAHLLRALEVVEQHRLPLAGSQASLGIPKPPTMSLLMAVPLAIGRDPRLAAGFIALLNVAAVAGCFLLARRYYNLRVAVVAAGLFAVNPWAVVLSRKIFTADVLAPFLVLYLYALHAAIVDRSGWGWLLAVLSFSAMLSITFSPLPLGLVLAILAAVFRRRIHWRPILAGGALAALLFMPYLYGQLRQPQQMAGLLHTLLDHLSQVRPGTRALQAAIWLHSGNGLGALAGASFRAFWPAHSPLRALDDLAALLFLAALPGTVALGLVAYRRREQREQAAGYMVLALWLLVSLAIISLGFVSPQPHYLVILYPAGFVAMALLVDRAWEALAARGGPHLDWAAAARLGLGAVLLAVALWQAYSVFYLYGFVATRNTAGGYGAPLRCWQRVADLARREARAAGLDEVWAIVQGVDVGHEEAPTILHYLLGPDLRAIFLGQGGNEALLLPLDRPALYLIARPLSAPAEALLGRLRSQERGSVASCDGRKVARVVLAPAHSRPELLSLIPHGSEWAFDAGLVLLGYEWPAAAHPGDSARFATYWTFRDIPAAERNVAHSLFNHLLTAGGEKVTQRDGLGLPERYWRPGLFLVQWFQLPLPAGLPAGDYTLLTGLYRLSDLSRNRVLGPGNAAGDAIPLGPVHVGD